LANRRMSYSFIHTYACPYANFLRYDAGIKPVTSKFIALGNGFHYALEMTHKDLEWDLKNAIDRFKLEFKRIIEDEDVFISFPEIKKMEAEGVEMVVTYDNVISSGYLPPNPLGVEVEFKLMVGDQEVVGRIDRLDGGPGNYELTDFKTGSKQPDPWFLNHNQQFTVYALAIQEMYGEIPKKLYWYQARTGKLLETTRTQDDIDEFRETVTNIAFMRENKIRHRVFHEAVCQWCDYSEGWGNKSGICADKKLEKELIKKVDFEWK